MDETNNKELFLQYEGLLSRSKFRIVYSGVQAKLGGRIFQLWRESPGELPSMVARLTEPELREVGLVVYDHGVYHITPSRYELREKNWFQV